MRYLRKIVICLTLGLLGLGALAATHPFATPDHAHVDRLSKRGTHGHIAVKAGRRSFPENAKISFARTRSENVKDKVVDGLAKNWRGRQGGKQHAKAPTPRVLAMYDVSINEGGRKWQPAVGEPVKVTVELTEPVAVAADAKLAVVHLADDGKVEELSASRYGFTFNAAKTEVIAFWFSAEGFSVYSIVDNSGTLVTARRFYHFYDHPSAIENSNAVQTLPYRYTDQTNDVINVQIVKDGDRLKEPPVPEDVLDEYGNLVSTFEGWYVVHVESRPAEAAESKLDSTTDPFVFVWPVGVTDHRLSFTNAVSVTETVDTDYYIVPLYEHARFLQFNETELTEQGAGSRIIDRKIVVINDETGHVRIKVSDISAALKNDRNEYFCGWRYLDKNGQYTDLYTYAPDGTFQNAYIEIDDDLFAANSGNVIPLYPIYAAAHFLNFDTNAKGSGATYVGSLFLRATSEISEVTPSGNRTGYDFDGWCAGILNGGNVTFVAAVSDAEGHFYPNVTATNATGAVILTTDADSNIHLNADVTLYARWRANTSASYRVIVWQQRVTDAKDAVETNKNYYYTTHYTSPTVPATTQISDALFTSFTGTRADGTSISSAVDLKTLSGKAETNVANEDFTGFHYARYSCTDETVAPDGSTVINVYYDRDLITLRFCLYQTITNSTVVTGNSTSGTQYGSDDNGATFFQIYYKSGSNNGWYKTKSGNSYSNPYSGTRYTITTSGSWEVDENLTMTGLYGQTLASNGYTWRSDLWWYDKETGASSRVRTTFLDAFLPTSAADDVFYGEEPSSTSATILFYKEALDGTWVQANSAYSSSGNFNISDKYNGFEAYQYSTDGGNTWKSVGTYNESTHYYGSQVSYTSQLAIRFRRKKFELIYKDGNETVYDTGKNVPYESSLAGYNLAVTNTLLNWGSRDTSVGTFAGWYEDASLTVPFDFSATMPDGKKFLYAKWNPVKYKVIIDPNGGQMQSGDSTWFYLDAGEKVIEYTVTRNFRLDMHNGTYYYHHDLWDPVLDKHTDQYDPSTEGAPRRAYYTENIAEATTNEVSDPGNRFSYEPNVYLFMGWYEVHEDGTLATDPFNFMEPPNRPVTLRALWRRTSAYALRYESIDPDGERPTEVICDPELGDEGGYIDDGETTLAKDPTNYDHEKWLWEGWQVIDVRNNNNPLTNIRSPGDMYIVHALHADDRDNVIHFRAVYSLREGGNSRHIPEVVDFVLDANEGAGLDANATIQTEDGRLGTYSDGAESSMGGLNAGVWFAAQQNNFAVDLGTYSAAFAHPNGHFLLGWDTNRVNDTVIPAYYANETIGIDKSDASENVLYAVWEPQVYIDFVNDTGANLTNITFYIPSWTADGLFRVNEVLGTYQRAVFSNFAEGAATFDLAAGETLRLVLPDAAGRDFAVFGDSAYAEGTKLVITRSEPQIAGEAAVPDEVFNAYAGEHYQVTGTMKTSHNPVQVRFTKSTYPTSTTVPVRYFLHDKNGTVTEITQYSATYWRAQNFKTSLTAGTASSDIAGMLRTDSVAQSIHELLSDNVRTNYGHTTIGIGVASAVITTDHETLHANEYRSITQEGASGGPYFRFYHEELDWSRYSQVWNGYDDPAVYVVFYKRTPVHVTIGKNVVGSEEDKSRTFDFTAQITQHSTNLEYTVTTTYRQTRTLTAQTSSKKKPSASEWNNPDWDDPVAVSTNASSVTASSDQTPDLFESRHPEQISLADAARHPITIYYDSTETNIGEPVESPKEVTDGDDSYTTSLSWTGLKYNHTMVQTRTWTQTVTYLVKYQYEVATIQEAETNTFTLTSIAGDGDSCKGTGNFAARTYTISSLSAPDAKGFFTYQSLDTAIFTNTRKTGSLTVSKTVVDGDVGDTFNFIVTLGETVVDKDNYVVPAGVHLGPFGKVFTFSLANGGSQTLTGLPAGATYTVEEVANDKYIASVPANAAGTIVADTTTAVGFTNTRKTDLSIAMKDRTVYFNGEEQHGCEITSVTGTGEAVDTDDYTVIGLKGGHVLTVEHHVAAHGTAVGSYVGHFENARVTVHDVSSNDVTYAYIVTTTSGSLTINPTPIVVTVTGNHETKTYNGEEQSCEGYTYVIEHATTHEPIESGSIYVSIPPEYQQAFRQDVGRSEMYIQPNRVNVTVPEGVSVSNIVVAANGYIVIEPAPVTVTVDDKEKFMGDVDPVFTATVTGLFGDDMVSYDTPSRVAGEEAGEYAITTSGASEQGNYTVAFVPGKLTITLLALSQRATDSDLPVMVKVTRSMLEASGFDMSGEITAETVSNYLNQVDANSLRRWENLVTGTATNQLILSDAVSASGSQMTFAKAVPAGDVVNLGYTVLYELQKNSSNGWERIAGPAAGLDATFTIDLLDAQGKSIGASGFYRLATLLVPNDFPVVTNTIPSTNIVGVLEVASSLTNTMTAVPWTALSTDPLTPGNLLVSSFMRPVQLSAGDTLHAITDEGVYQKYTVDSSGTWTAAAATVTMGKTVTTPAANERELPRGNSVWVTRQDPSQPFFLIGQYSGEDIDETVTGSAGDTAAATMIANPRLTALAINDIDWGGNPTTSDVVWIPSEKGISTTLRWTRDSSDGKMKWGVLVQNRATRTSYLKSDWTVPAGMGFWYNRKGAAFTITVPVDKVKE